MNLPTSRPARQSRRRIRVVKSLGDPEKETMKSETLSYGTEKFLSSNSAVESVSDFIVS
jgi:hypothetical protein